MKTGNVSQNTMSFQQAKSIREDKAAHKREPDKAAGDKVDLSAKRLSAMSAPVASHVEALELIKSIDFSQAKGADLISKDGQAKIMELLQA